MNVQKIRPTNILLSCLVYICLLNTSLSACTSFCLTANDTVIFGNNLDWYIGDGVIFINKRNVLKTGCWFSNKPTWTSKYGSITINQFGREFPSRGMNETGLVIGEMTLESTQFPDADSRSPISLLQWTQYQLDNCATIEEVIATDEVIRIDLNEYHSHFLVADRNGNCVSMEWLNGELVYHTHDSLPIKVLTNDTYENCLNFYNNNEMPLSSNYSSEARFYRAAEMIQNYDLQNDGPVVTHAFNILRSVGPGDWTKWSLVFDVTNLRFHIRTSTNANIRYVDFDVFDFSCDTPVKAFDIDNQFFGDIQHYFVDYTFELNRALVLNTFEQYEAQSGSVSNSVKNTIANYPSTTRCEPDLALDEINSNDIQYGLFQNFPNPFNPETTIQYAIRTSSQVKLTIYDLLGQEIQTLQKGIQQAGRYSFVWDATDNSKNPVSSGIYFYRLEIKEQILQKKMILIR